MRRPTRPVLLLLLVAAVLAAWYWYHTTRSPAPAFAGPGVTAADLPPSPPAPGNLRIVAWNVRNFPRDERPQYPDLGYSRRTNERDLVAVLAGLDAHVIGLEEIRDPARFGKILARAGGERHAWRTAFTRGGGRWGQHVGIAWDEKVLRRVGDVREVEEVALGDPDLRPALAVYLRSVDDGGADFTVVQVHLRAGRKGYGTRLRQYRALASWVRGWLEEVDDCDVIVQGDFNTTGPSGEGLGDWKERLAAELAEADRILGEAGLRRLPNASGCSEYWEGPGDRDGVQQPSELDQVYLGGMEELDGSVPLAAWLHCARYGCSPFVSRPGEEDGTFWDVSDHCPLTFEIRNVDLDGAGLPWQGRAGTLGHGPADLHPHPPGHGDMETSVRQADRCRAGQLSNRHEPWIRASHDPWASQDARPGRPGAGGDAGHGGRIHLPGPARAHALPGWQHSTIPRGGLRPPASRL